MPLQSPPRQPSARCSLSERTLVLMLHKNISSTRASLFLTRIIPGGMRKTDVAYKAPNRRVSIVSWSDSEFGICPIRCGGLSVQPPSWAESECWPLTVTWTLSDEMLALNLWRGVTSLSEHMSSKHITPFTKLILSFGWEYLFYLIQSIAQT